MYHSPTEGQLGCFQFSTTVHKDATNRFYVNVSFYFSGINTSANARSDDRCMFSFVRSCRTVFRSSCTILHPVPNVGKISKHFREMQNIHGYSILFKQLPADSYIGDFHFVIIRPQLIYLYVHKNVYMQITQIPRIGSQAQIF